MANELSSLYPAECHSISLRRSLSMLSVCVSLCVVNIFAICADFSLNSHYLHSVWSLQLSFKYSVNISSIVTNQIEYDYGH